MARPDKISTLPAFYPDLVPADSSRRVAGRVMGCEVAGRAVTNAVPGLALTHEARPSFLEANWRIGLRFT